MININADLILVIWVVILGSFCIGVVLLAFILSVKPKNKDNTNQPTEHQPESDYVKPQLKPLTAEQIAEIHARGKITPAEQLAEWESMDLCVPGDAIGSAAWRCRKFRNCHDCLIDFANEHDEYTPIVQIMQESQYRSTKL